MKNKFTAVPGDNRLPVMISFLNRKGGVYL